MQLFKRREFLKYLGMGAAAMALPRYARGAGASPSPAGVRPNFLLMIADDLNLHDLGCMGNPDVKSPNIDRLARDGMTLRGMYTPAPTCSPCRHALYTGLFPVRSGAYPNHTRAYDGTASIFTHLKALGYPNERNPSRSQAWAHTEYSMCFRVSSSSAALPPPRNRKARRPHPRRLPAL
jgi:uncharacterized sulfatase